MDKVVQFEQMLQVLNITERSSKLGNKYCMVTALAECGENVKRVYDVYVKGSKTDLKFTDNNRLFATLMCNYGKFCKLEMLDCTNVTTL